MSASAQVLIGSQSTAASVTDTNLELVAGSAALLRVTRLRLTQSTHKTSEQVDMQVQRITTTGTGTSTTPLIKEPSTAALGSARIGTCKTADSVEPTYTASTVLVQAACNSLTGRDIVYPPGQELYVVPSALLGVAVVTPSGTTTASYRNEADFEVLG